MAARILVADDSVTIQKVVELTFSKEDFVLVQARSGEEALRKAKEERPDLVLLDLVMPDKNGYEVCAALRAEATLRAVPIILLTGTFEAFDKDKGIQAGANDFVTKPFESQVLISKVKQLLFAKTVDMAPSKAAPPKEAPRPAPAAPSRPGIPPGPGPRGVAPPSPAPTTPPLSAGRVPPQPAVPPAPVQAVPPGPSPTMAAIPPERPVPAKLAPPPPIVPPKTGRTLDLSPPSEEISQDRVRRVVEPPPSVPPSPAPGGFGEFILADLSTLPLAEAPGRPGDAHLESGKGASGPAPVSEELSLDMPSLAPEPVQEKKRAPTPEEKAGALPESLSLEELLSAEPTAAPLAPEAALAPLEEFPGGPVFDLTSEMGGPSLPLVEVGTGEPPALSIEDLLASAESAPPPPAEVGALEPSAPGPETAPEELAGEPVLDLTSAQEPPLPRPLEVGAEESLALSVEDFLPTEETAPTGAGMMGLHELELEPISGPSAEEAPATEPAPTAELLLDLGELAEVRLTAEERVDLEATLAGGEAPVPPAVVPPSGPAMGAGAGLAEVPTAADASPEITAAPPIVPRMPTMAAVPPVVAATPGPGGAEALLPEMAAMRQEVTERVAHELARDLSDKLLGRIERIVWEVVPDLAEILISKEIERIRLQAEGKQSS
ncbi:MAG: response regulator [Candidatus Methylomirabilales bacterium]